VENKGVVVTGFSSRDDREQRQGDERKTGTEYPVRREQNSAEVIDEQRVEMRPLCRYGCKFLKRKGLKA
jgi:hypothetical protein